MTYSTAITAMEKQIKCEYVQNQFRRLLTCYPLGAEDGWAWGRMKRTSPNHDHVEGCRGVAPHDHVRDGTKKPLEGVDGWSLPGMLGVSCLDRAVINLVAIDEVRLQSCRLTRGAKSVVNLDINSLCQRARVNNTTHAPMQRRERKG